MIIDVFLGVLIRLVHANRSSAAYPSMKRDDSRKHLGIRTLKLQRIA